MGVEGENTKEGKCSTSEEGIVRGVPSLEKVARDFGKKNGLDLIDICECNIPTECTIPTKGNIPPNGYNNFDHPETVLHASYDEGAVSLFNTFVTVPIGDPPGIRYILTGKLNGEEVALNAVANLNPCWYPGIDEVHYQFHREDNDSKWFLTDNYQNKYQAIGF